MVDTMAGNACQKEWYCDECGAMVAIEQADASIIGSPDDYLRCANGCNWHPCGRVDGCDAIDGRWFMSVGMVHSCLPDWWRDSNDDYWPNPCTVEE